VTTDALKRKYEAALASKIALGPEHESPDCECPVCDREHELYFIVRHADDDAPRDSPPQPEITDPDIPF
jgi:hypothetical protein